MKNLAYLKNLVWVMSGVILFGCNNTSGTSPNPTPSLSPTPIPTPTPILAQEFAVMSVESGNAIAVYSVDKNTGIISPIPGATVKLAANHIGNIIGKFDNSGIVVVADADLDNFQQQELITYKIDSSGQIHATNTPGLLINGMALANGIGNEASPEYMPIIANQFLNVQISSNFETTFTNNTYAVNQQSGEISLVPNSTVSINGPYLGSDSTHAHFYFPSGDFSNVLSYSVDNATGAISSTAKPINNLLNLTNLVIGIKPDTNVMFFYNTGQTQDNFSALQIESNGLATGDIMVSPVINNVAGYRASDITFTKYNDYNFIYLGSGRWDNSDVGYTYQISVFPVNAFSFVGQPIQHISFHANDNGGGIFPGGLINFDKTGEFVYFQDLNNDLLHIYQVNKTTGVLTKSVDSPIAMNHNEIFGGFILVKN